VNGVKQGQARWYFKNGKPSTEYTYDKGNLSGPSKSYNEEGFVTSEGNYVNNDEDGEWKEYDAMGKLLKKVIYKNGKVVKEVKVKQ